MENKKNQIEASRPPRRSYEVMGQVLSHGDATELGRLLQRAPQGITAWMRAPRTRNEFKTSGRSNPLDILRTLFTMVREDDGEPDRAYPIVQYLAGFLDGVFVPISRPSQSPEADILSRLSTVLKNTGEVLESARKFGFESSRAPGAKAECLKDIDAAIVALMQLKLKINPTGR